MDLFDSAKPTYSINKKIRLIELFAGIGSQAMALKSLGVDFEHYRVCEFDEFAIKSYNAIHGTNFETTDIRNLNGSDLGIVDKDKYEYILTYSFPCTDLSLAGKQKGMSKQDWENGTSTRSGLLWEVERLIKESKELPQVLLMENVTQVHSAKNIQDFEMWIKFLESKGYTNTYFDMNAKDYGTAQSRNRCFMVSVLGEYKQIEKPNPIKLTKTMKDYLEPKVDEKYYLKSEKAQKLIDNLIEKGVLPTHSDNREQRTENREQRTEKLNVLTCVCQVEKSQSQTEFVQDTIQESKNTHLKTAESVKLLCAMNYKRIDKFNIPIARTLCARDYKGFGTGYNVMNGIIEICT